MPCLILRQNYVPKYLKHALFSQLIGQFCLFFQHFLPLSSAAIFHTSCIPKLSGCRPQAAFWPCLVRERPKMLLGLRAIPGWRSVAGQQRSALVGRLLPKRDFQIGDDARVLPPGRKAFYVHALNKMRVITVQLCFLFVPFRFRSLQMSLVVRQSKRGSGCRRAQIKIAIARITLLVNVNRRLDL